MVTLIKFLTNRGYPDIGATVDRNQMNRLLEIVTDIRQKYPADTFFDQFETKSLNDPLYRGWYSPYKSSLDQLDPISWGILKNKAIEKFLDHGRPIQLKEAFFAQLNEAFAYCYLIDRGFVNIEFLAEDKTKKPKKRPDLKYFNNGEAHFCEVKTIGISNNEIKGRGSFRTFSYNQLDEGFFKKLHAAIEKGQKQILAVGTKGIVFVYILTDDPSGRYIDNYKDQLKAIVASNQDIILKFHFAYTDVL
jgi:hypothetical protein